MTAERKRFVGLFGVLCVAAILSFWPKSGSDATVHAAASPRGREKAKSVDPTDIPAVSLSPDAHGGGDDKIRRNIFVFYNSPTPTPPPPPPTPTPMGEYVGNPSPLTPTPTVTPIIPPRIPYTAIGIMGPKDRPIVVLEDGSRQILAREGDVLDGKFRIQRINRESVDFTFPNLPKEITTRLPVTPEGR